jgi:hypothetical protein
VNEEQSDAYYSSHIFLVLLLAVYLKRSYKTLIKIVAVYLKRSDKTLTKIVNLMIPGVEVPTLVCDIYLGNIYASIN